MRKYLNFPITSKSDFERFLVTFASQNMPDLKHILRIYTKNFGTTYGHGEPLRHWDV